VKRREFLICVGGVAIAWPVRARGQQAERMRRVGALLTQAADHLEVQARLSAFRETLQQLGWIEDRNLTLAQQFEAKLLDFAQAR